MESLPEEGRGFRHRKKQTEPICCPVCGITIRSSEIEQHYALEIDRLIKLQLNPKLKRTLNNGSTYHDPLPGCSSNGGNGNGTTNESSGCPWVTFQKIRNNRHSRLKIKTKKRKADEPVCPICNEYPNEDINVHVEMCLRKSENANKSNGGSGGGGENTTTSDDDESIDIEGEYSFDEYEWAGQKRIRASSLLEGGYSGTGIGTSITNTNHHSNNSSVSCNNDDDEDEDLNVDGDDTQIYGLPQYSERDVIVPLSDEYGNASNSDTYLRRLVTGQDLQTSTAMTTTVTNTTSYSSSTAGTGATNNVIRNDLITTTATGGGGVNNTITNNNSHHHNINSLVNTDTGNHNKMNLNLRNNDENLSTSSSITDNKNSNNINSHIIESLKAKIREYESQISNKIKCLICMDEFRNPAVSICCWHVHCEECWLRTLGARKLCPQCNMITSAADLRRIYM